MREDAAGRTAVEDEHLIVDLDTCADEAVRSCADVLYGTGCPELATELLRRYPGCMVVAVRDARGGCLCLSRDGVRVVVAARSGAAMPVPEQALLASLLHVWRSASSRGVTVGEAGRAASWRPLR
jgi:hypothetical protein